MKLELNPQFTSCNFSFSSVNKIFNNHKPRDNCLTSLIVEIGFNGR